MQRAKLILWAFLALMIAIIALIIISPIPGDMKIYMPQLVVVILMHVGATVIFIMGLKGFRQRLKKSYLLICTSMLLIVIGILQGIAIGIIGADNSLYSQLGGSSLPFIISIILAYFSAKLIVHQLQIESVLLKSWLVLGFGFAAGILFVLWPTARTDASELTIDSSAFLYGIAAVVTTAGTILFFKAMQQSSRLYKAPLRWLVIYYGAMAAAIIANLFVEHYLPSNHWYHAYGLDYMVYNFTAVVALIAAMSFNRVAYAEDQITKFIQKGTSTNSVDVIMSLAQLVSSPKNIDPILDELRLLTVSLKKDAGLTSEQQSTTARIYLGIEGYLTDQEPVRKFTRQQLRQMIDMRFKGAVTEPIFWQKLSSVSK